jgi:hypothetical protein
MAGPASGVIFLLTRILPVLFVLVNLLLVGGIVLWVRWKISVPHRWRVFASHGAGATAGALALAAIGTGIWSFTLASILTVLLAPTLGGLFAAGILYRRQHERERWKRIWAVK